MDERDFKYRLIIPLALLLIIVMIYPLGYSLWVSLHDFKLTSIGQEHFIGFSNYWNILKDHSFWRAISNTIIFVVLAVFLEFLIGFTLALMLHRETTPFRNIFRAILLSPMFITPIAVGLMFRFLLNSQLGFVPVILNKLGINIDWFSYKMALFTLVLIDVWQWTPFMLLLLLAGLESLSQDPFEAAKVDGAEGWNLIRYITLPLLKPVILAAIIIRMLDAFKVYEYVYAITRGGPGEATETIQYHIYRVGFLYFRLGEASAMAYLLIIVILVLVLILYHVLQREHANL